MVDTSKPARKTFQRVQNFLTPASFITAAEEAHPAFRYAIAVAGLFAIVVIFAKFGVSLAALVLGAIAVIALMVVFLVFAQASKLTRTHLNLPAQVLVWAYLLMIVGGSLLVIASIFFNAPLPLRTLIVQKLSITAPATTDVEKQPQVSPVPQLLSNEISGVLFENGTRLRNVLVDGAGVTTRTDDTGSFQILLPNNKLPSSGQKIALRIQIAGRSPVIWSVLVPYRGEIDLAAVQDSQGQARATDQ
jgi:hypothetical protein